MLVFFYRNYEFAKILALLLPYSTLNFAILGSKIPLMNLLPSNCYTLGVQCPLDFVCTVCYTATANANRPRFFLSLSSEISLFCFKDWNFAKISSLNLQIFSLYRSLYNCTALSLLCVVWYTSGLNVSKSVFLKTNFTIYLETVS